MGALIVGVLGLAAVLFGAMWFRTHRPTRPPLGRDHRWERWDTFGYCTLTYLCFFVGPGIAAVAGLINDPVRGLALEAIMGGSLLFVILVLAAILNIRRPLPAGQRRVRAYQFTAYFLLALLFFLVPGVLAALQLIPDIVPGITMGAAIAVYFSIELVRFREAEQITEPEPAAIEERSGTTTKKEMDA